MDSDDTPRQTNPLEQTSTSALDSTNDFPVILLNQSTFP
jgi:hypothetical protein